MSSSKIVDDSYLDISFKEAVRFFKKQSSPGECPMCKSVSWSIPMATEDASVSLSDTGMRDLNGSPVLELKMQCKVCGFLRAHRASFIRDWLDSNPAPNEVSDDV